MIDILNLEPTKISRDLKGKYIAIYGQPKTGKTTFATQCPNNLLLAFEKGYNFLSGVMAQDIEKWVDFKNVIRQLDTDAAKAKFDTISIDTVGIAWDMCEKYVCMQNQVQSISDIAWGKGFAQCKKEFESCLRQITMMGYGLVIIAHSELKTTKDDNGDDIEVVRPAIPTRAYEIVNRLVDIIGYIGVRYNDQEAPERVLYTRATKNITAGSRLKYLNPQIPFGYTELVDNLVEAIEKDQALNGAMVSDAPVIREETKKTFDEVRSEGANLWNELVNKDAENATAIMDIVEKVFGKRMKLSEITAPQQDLFEFVIQEMKELG